jgi:hypothetical protein
MIGLGAVIIGRPHWMLQVRARCSHRQRFLKKNILLLTKSLIHNDFMHARTSSPPPSTQTSGGGVIWITMPIQLWRRPIGVDGAGPNDGHKDWSVVVLATCHYWCACPCQALATWDDDLTPQRKGTERSSPQYKGPWMLCMHSIGNNHTHTKGIFLTDANWACP